MYLVFYKYVEVAQNGLSTASLNILLFDETRVQAPCSYWLASHANR